MENEINDKKIKDFINDKDSLKKLSIIFKMFSDPTRLKIIYILAQNSLCVTDIANYLDMEQSAISHQLALLREKNLVKSKRKGKKIIYSLTDKHVYSLFKDAYEHVSHKSNN